MVGAGRWRRSAVASRGRHSRGKRSVGGKRSSGGKHSRRLKRCSGERKSNSGGKRGRGKRRRNSDSDSGSKTRSVGPGRLQSVKRRKDARQNSPQKIVCMWNTYRD